MTTKAPQLAANRVAMISRANFFGDINRLKEELKVWWASDSSQAKKDILKGFQFSEEPWPTGKLLLRWFILGKEVCKFF